VDPVDPVVVDTRIRGVHDDD
jgi:hypothetical protein